jgi:CubicO group peptidase (beta-lactamase class C family)
MGAEQSAHITVDTGGFTLASGGMSATLRDIARVGQLMLDRGKADDRQVIPGDWLDDIFDHARPINPLASPVMAFKPHTPVAPYYRSFVWGIGDGAGTVYAEGVHGQFIFVSPSTRTVIAMFSSWPNADGGASGVGHVEAMAFLFAIRDAVTD